MRGMIAEGWGQAAEGLLWIEEGAMPSVLGLMERREARARQDLEPWTEVLEQAQAEVDAARERVERARGRSQLAVPLSSRGGPNATGGGSRSGRFPAASPLRYTHAEH